MHSYLNRRPAKHCPSMATGDGWFSFTVSFETLLQNGAPFGRVPEWRSRFLTNSTRSLQSSEVVISFIFGLSYEAQKGSLHILFFMLSFGFCFERWHWQWQQTGREVKNSCMCCDSGGSCSGKRRAANAVFNCGCEGCRLTLLMSASHLILYCSPLHPDSLPEECTNEQWP